MTLVQSAHRVAVSSIFALFFAAVAVCAATPVIPVA